MGKITNRLGTKINKQPISTKQFVALSVHTKSTIQQTFKNKHAEKSNMGKNSKSNEKHTWIALVAIALFPFPLFFTPKNPQNPPNLSVSSSMCLFPTILSCAPLLFFSFSPYIRISLSNSLCSRESTFLSSISLPFSKIRMLISSHTGSSLSICMQPH